MTQLILVDVSDPNSGQAKQNRRSVVQARGLSRLLPQQQQDFKRSRAPHLRRAARRSKPALPGQDRRASIPAADRFLDGVTKGARLASQRNVTSWLGWRELRVRVMTASPAQTRSSVAETSDPSSAVAAPRVGLKPTTLRFEIEPSGWFRTVRISTR
jgi:hypothetical protein